MSRCGNVGNYRYALAPFRPHEGLGTTQRSIRFGQSAQPACDIIRHHTIKSEYPVPGPDLGPESAILPHIIIPRAQNMAGQSMFGPGTALGAGLPWLKSATVSLWRRAPGWSTRAVTWAWKAAVALAFLAFVIFASIMLLYAAYTLGSLGIYVRQVFR